MSSTFKSIAASMPSDAFIHTSDSNRLIHYIEPVSRMKEGIDPHTIYIGDYTANVLNYRSRGATLLLYTTGPIVLPDLLPQDCNIIVMQKQMYASDLNTDLLQIINSSSRFNEITQEFLSIVQGGGSLQKLLNYACSQLGNPLMLVDISFGYIASAGTGDLSNEENWDFTIRHGVMPSEYLSRILNEDAQYLDSDSDSPQILFTDRDSKNAYRSYSVKVSYRNNIHGYLKILERDSRFTDFDQELFIALGKYIGIMADAMIQLCNFNTDTAENMLASILTGKADPYQGAEALKELSPQKLFKYTRLLSIRFSDLSEHSDHIYYLQRKLKHYFQKNIIAKVSDHIVILYNTPSEPTLSDTDRASFIKFLQEHECTADISLVFHDLNHLKDYYDQLLFCNEYREMTVCTDTLLYYNDIYEFQMISSLKNKVDLKLLVHPAIRTLEEYDRRSGGELTKTLFTYLENNSSITTTAEALFVHYNTIKHRINKIIELTGLDLDNKDEVFKIILSKKILRVSA